MFRYVTLSNVHLSFYNTYNTHNDICGNKKYTPEKIYIQIHNYDTGVCNETLFEFLNVNIVS